MHLHILSSRSLSATPCSYAYRWRSCPPHPPSKTSTTIQRKIQLCQSFNQPLPFFPQSFPGTQIAMAVLTKFSRPLALTRLKSNLFLLFLTIIIRSVFTPYTMIRRGIVYLAQEAGITSLGSVITASGEPTCARGDQGGGADCRMDSHACLHVQRCSSRLESICPFCIYFRSARRVWADIHPF